MLHTVLSVLALTAALLVAELVKNAPPQLGAVVLVLVTTAAALVASRVGPMALASGALAAVAWTLLRPVAPALAGAALVTLVLAARATRVLLVPHRVLHGALSISGGGIAGWTLAHFAGHGALAFAAQPMAATVVSAMALGLPLWIGCEDPDGHALLALARRSRGPARARLLRAVALRRRAMSRMSLRADERRILRRAFRELTTHGERLVERGTPAAAMLEVLSTRLATLQRAVRALAAVEVEEQKLEAGTSDAAERTAESAEARRDALRALAA